LRQIRARVIFLALGSPMQERWLAKYAGKLESVRVCQGVGGTLDTIAGTVKRAPEFWCRMNLEWFYRLVSQPSRIRRQRVLPVFAWQVVRKAVLGKERGRRTELLEDGGQRSEDGGRRLEARGPRSGVNRSQRS